MTIQYDMSVTWPYNISVKIAQNALSVSLALTA